MKDESLELEGNEDLQSRVFPYDPRGHATLILNDRRLQRVRQLIA
jgi:hypothetical protein